jgi:hypothetical protein
VGVVRLASVLCHLEAELDSPLLAYAPSYCLYIPAGHITDIPDGDCRLGREEHVMAEGALVTDPYRDVPSVASDLIEKVCPIVRNSRTNGEHKSTRSRPVIGLREVRGERESRSVQGFKHAQIAPFCRKTPETAFSNRRCTAFHGSAKSFREGRQVNGRLSAQSVITSSGITNVFGSTALPCTNTS